MNDNKVMLKAADNIRILAAAMVEKAKSGHPGGAMGGADFINTLYSEFLVYDPENPEWEGRDRFFLDPGHMAPMLYSQLCGGGRYPEDGEPHPDGKVHGPGGGFLLCGQYHRQRCVQVRYPVPRRTDGKYGR